MTFICGPIQVDVLIRHIWLPTGGHLVQDERGRWRGDLTLPIGKLHVCPSSCCEFWSEVLLKRYDYAVQVAHGFCGRAEVVVGFSTRSRAKSGEEITYAEWDLLGNKMSLTTDKFATQRTDVWRQGLASDAGMHLSIHIRFTIYIWWNMSTGRSNCDEYGYSYLRITRGNWTLASGQSTFTPASGDEPYIIIRLAMGPSSISDVKHLSDGMLYITSY